jgi:hypothetical protein
MGHMPVQPRKNTSLRTIAVHLIRHGPMLRKLCLPIAPPYSTFCTMAVQLQHHRGALDPPRPHAAQALPANCTAVQHFLHMAVQLQHHRGALHPPQPPAVQTLPI